MDGRIFCRSLRSHPLRNVTTQIVALAGDNIPYAPGRIFDIAIIPGNQVNVDVHHRLTCGGADIDPDIVAEGSVRVVVVGFQLVHEPKDRAHFRLSQVEEGPDVPVRTDEQVA